ncbi:MAG: type II toxin-antitoxin system PemK/MazF family toxin [Desulfobacteraceae bacterium]|nr:type II toxin-antitoxin system PemK/MazF family toxin [Desulfobacteraceae bacterium]
MARPYVVVTNNIYNARVPLVQVVPLTAWSEKKARIITNVEIIPSPRNGLIKKSVADCLQSRPMDHRARCVNVRGEMEAAFMTQIDDALKIVFDLH